nr:ATP-dependent DNA helicase Q-like SIM isoform X4 [Coffea arabica]
MERGKMTSDQVVAELIGMGFEFDDVKEAIKAVGPSLDDAVEFILNGCCRKSRNVLGSSTSSLGGSTSSKKSAGKMRQLSIIEHLQCGRKPNKSSKFTNEPHLVMPSSVRLLGTALGSKESLPETSNAIIPCYKDEDDIGRSDWEMEVKNILNKHFGHSFLKPFQKEALAAWIAHKDSLVLAATGSGKSLCFQIPALLTGKVVVVISPLISLMHDQCLMLAKHGVSACFLGSGQIDKSVEEKAMNGIYGIIYVCPETVLRLIGSLQRLAESRGIALFAIDEGHCVSKWGHDFRPDYRRLSILRESFSTENLKFLKFDIPLMALTATATIRVRDDILKSLCMSMDSKIIVTSFFRPNLRFSVKHSRTSSLSSYEKDFHELIEIFTRKKKFGKAHQLMSKNLEHAPDNMSRTATCDMFEPDTIDDDDAFSESDSEVGMSNECRSASSKDKKLSVEYLEDECDVFQDTDDLDVSCGEFSGQSTAKILNESDSTDAFDLQSRSEERLKLQLGPLEEGPTIIYVPTRKETLSLAKLLSRFGVKSAAYNAKLPKAHLRQVHKEFHDNILQVVVATIAFGMGINKLNVRRIIHYGWPQSLEAYYQEAGRAGRDGKLADCVLYANLTRIPTLLPSQRSEEQTKQAYKMLSDCFRYGMHTSSCRAKMLVEYFGQEFVQKKCFLCDICTKGPPEAHNLKKEVTILMQAIISHNGQNRFQDVSYNDAIEPGVSCRRFVEKSNLKRLISTIREQDFSFLHQADYSFNIFQHHEFISSDLLWWQGLARVLEDKGFIKDGDDKAHVQIKFPEPTESGLQLLRSENRPFYVYPEADMMLSMRNRKPYSSFAEWGKGWADPEIRRQRLKRKREGSWKRPKERKMVKPDMKTVRGRLVAKILKRR